MPTENSATLKILSNLKPDQAVEIDVDGVIFHGLVEKIDVKDGWVKVLDVIDTNWIKISSIGSIALLCRKNCTEYKSDCKENRKENYKKEKSESLPFAKLLKKLKGTIVEVFVNGSTVDGIISRVDLDNDILCLTEPNIEIVHQIPISHLDVVLQCLPSTPF